jgi:protein TonB
MVTYYRTYQLPWELSQEEEQRFLAILKKVGIITLVLSIILSLLPIPEADFDDIERVPPRFAKLILEKPKPLPPPPVVQPEREEKIPEPKVAEQKEVVPEPVVEPKPVDRTEDARKKASVAGLLLFADDLAELRDNQAVASVTSDRELTGPAGETARTERSLITSSAGKASGGINTAGMSRNTGGSGLADHDTTKVSSSVAGLGNGPVVQRPGASDLPARSREEIEMVFDKNKGAIYALYNRALRRDPTLQGKLVLRLTIEPSGAVSFCEVVSSEIEDEALQRKLVQRIKLFRFLEKNVESITTTKPIDFFPA